MALRVLLLALVAAFGCARTPIDPHLGGGAGSRSDIVEEPAPDPEQLRKQREPREPPHVDDDAVERAALPFHGLRIRDGEPAPPERLFEVLSGAHAVCVGEHHDNPHHHFAQLQVLNALLRRAAMGRQVGLGLEMVQQHYQEGLDQYAERHTNEEQLLDAIEWNGRWGFSFALYRPMVELARAHGAPLLALNAPREVIAQIAKGGVAAVDKENQRHLPELDLEDSAHRAWFEQQMKGHPATGKKAEHRYTAQVMWDEAMADAAAAWLSARHPVRQLVILAGAGHCMGFAIPKRLKRRLTTARVISVLPVLSQSGDPAIVRAQAKGYDYAFVMTTE